VGEGIECTILPQCTMGRGIECAILP